MKDQTKQAIEKVEYDLSILSGALRAVGMSMSTIGPEHKDLSMPLTYIEDQGFLVESLARYAEKLATDLDMALIKAKKEGAR